jgi:HAD superfamily hydrolase (TIGR01549 family)
LVELLELKGIKTPEKDKRFHDALGDLGKIIKKEVKKIEIENIHNVENLVKRIVAEKHVVGLLTGNTHDKAKVKLEKAGLWKYFKTGAFGHESRIRSKLVPIAMKDAKKKTGIAFSKEDVFIVGDTVRDIQCAKEAGVKSIAVATGNESLDQFRKEKPDYLFEDFSDVDKIAAAIMK